LVVKSKIKTFIGKQVIILQDYAQTELQYDIQLWSSASNSNIEILERFQLKVLQILIDAPWFVTNEIIRRNLRIPTIKEEINNGSLYINKLTNHPN